MLNELSELFIHLSSYITPYLVPLIVSFILLLIIFIIYKFIAIEVQKIKKRKVIRPHTASLVLRLVQFTLSVIFFVVLFGTFGFTIGTFGGLLTALIGTILGFAAINTLGNAIAGLIIMTSNPFELGDRIYLNGQFVDVIDVGLIFTEMNTIENVRISIPNQKLLETEIDNYGKRKLVRRSCTVSAGFEYEDTKVEEALLDSLKEVEKVLQTPKPYVRITTFQNFAIEYTLYYYIKDVKNLQKIEADVRKEVLNTFKKRDIDLSTPNLIRSV